MAGNPPPIDYGAAPPDIQGGSKSLHPKTSLHPMTQAHKFSCNYQSTTSEFMKSFYGNSSNPGGVAAEGNHPVYNPQVPTISLDNHRIPMQSSIPPFQAQYDPVHHSRPPPSFPPPPGGRWHDGYDRHDVTHASRNNNRGRTTYSDEQVSELELMFARNPYPTPQARQQLSRDISVPESKIKIWFQNRRARAKKLRVGVGGWRGCRPPHPPNPQNVNNNSNNVTTANHYVTTANHYVTSANHYVTTANQYVTSGNYVTSASYNSKADKFVAPKWPKEPQVPLVPSVPVPNPALSLSGLSLRQGAIGSTGAAKDRPLGGTYTCHHHTINSLAFYNDSRAAPGAFPSGAFPPRFPVITHTSDFSVTQQHDYPAPVAMATSSGAPFSDVVTPPLFSGVKRHTGAPHVGENPEFSSPPPIRRFVFPFKNFLESGWGESPWGGHTSSLPAPAYVRPQQRDVINPPAPTYDVTKPIAPYPPNKLADRYYGASSYSLNSSYQHKAGGESMQWLHCDEQSRIVAASRCSSAGSVESMYAAERGKSPGNSKQWPMGELNQAVKPAASILS